MNELNDVIADIRAKHPLPGTEVPVAVQQPDWMQNNLAAIDKEKNTNYSSKPIIDVNTNYTRLNDGSYIPKTETFLGNTGNENRLALEQSTGEKWLNGIGKFIAKTGTYTADATVGTLYGLYKGVAEGSLEAVWNNDFSKSLDDLNTQLDGALPNYYTDAEKNLNVFQSMGTANFWVNDFANGLAFVTANVLSGKAAGVVTKGFKLGNALPQWGLKAGNKSTIAQVEKQLAKQGAQSADEIAVASKGLAEGGLDLAAINKQISETTYDNIIKGGNKNLLKQTTLGKVGGAIDVAAFSIRTGTFEAGMEARTNLKEATDTFIDNYMKENGEAPSLEEMTHFIDSATKTANVLFGANMAILAPSNLIMFGKASGIGVKTFSKVNSFENKILGKGINLVRAEGKITATGKIPSMLQKNIARGQSLLWKPAVEGFYEEGLQGVAGKTMQNYLADKYDGDGNYTVDGWAALNNAFAEQYTTKDGFKEMFIGALIGGIGGAFQSKPKDFLKDVRNNWTQSNTAVENEKQATRANAAFTPIQTRLSGAEALMKSAKRQHSLTEGFDYTDPKQTKTPIDFNEAIAEDANANWNYLNAIDGIRSDSETRDDYKFVVENMAFTDEIEKSTGLTKEEFEEYKTGLIENFNRQSVLSRKVKSAVEAMGIEGQIEISEGNTREAKDVIAHSIFMGMESLPISKTIAAQLDQALGTNGSFDSMAFYTNLNDEHIQLVDEFSSLQNEIDLATKASIELQNQRYNQADVLSAVGAKGNQGATNASEAKLKRIREAEQQKNEQLVALNEKVRKNEDRLSVIRATLGQAQQTNNFGLRDTFGITNEGLVGFDVDSVLAQIKSVDGLIVDLKKNGKVREASVIETLLHDFQVHSGRVRESQKMHQAMLAPNFFKTKKGRYLISNILGEKYTISDKLKKQLEENDEKISKSLLANGYETLEENATQIVKRLIENNKDLSDREKFRAEKLLKAALMSSEILNGTTASEDIVENPIVDPTEVKKGDIAKKLQDIQDNKELTNSEQLEELIFTIINEVNKLFKDTIKGVDILSKPDFKRLKSLLDKQQQEELTEEEETELEGLKTQFDRWTTMDGIVIGGVRLSDLIRRAMYYEKLSVTTADDTFKLEGFESMGISEFENRLFESFYNLLQSYVSATVIGKNENEISIQSLSIQALADEIGAIPSTPKTQRNSTATLTIGNKVIEIRTDSRNNLIFNKEDIEFLNENTNLIIKPTNDKLSTRYSILLSKDSNGEIKPVQSDFNFQGEVVEEGAIYELKPNDELRVVLDPNDEYNQDLLSELPTASQSSQTNLDKELDKVLKKLRKTNEDYDQAKTDIEFLAPSAPVYQESKDLVDKIEAAELLKLQKKNPPTKTVTLTQEQKENLVENMVVKLYDSEDKLVGVLKAGRGKYEGETEQKFATLRKNIVMANIDRILQNPTDKIDVSNNVVKVKDIFLGHPNYNFKSEDKSLGTVFTDFSEKDADNVLDIGFMYKGEVKLKENTQGVDTTYLGAFKKDTVNKIAFVVIDFKGKKVALPVNLRNIDKSAEIQELEKVLYSKMDHIEKGMVVDSMMAALGFDPNIRGNSLEYFSEANNSFNEENYERILGKVKEKYYLYKIEDALTSTSGVKEIVMNEMQKNINMSQPFHSPKVEINLGEIEIDPGVVTQPTAKKKQTKNSIPSTQAGQTALGILKKCKK